MSGGYSLDISEGDKKPEGNGKKLLYALIGVGIILIIVGIALIVVGSVKKTNCDGSGGGGGTSTTKAADYSTEARKVGLGEFLEEVKSTYFKMNPNLIVRNPDATPSTIREVFSPYNCHPEALKKRTDAAKSLYDRSVKIQKEIDRSKLDPREAKAIAQVQHFLQSNFGAPYDENYYAGDWLLGPNLFCWQPICDIGSDLASHFNLKDTGFSPSNEKDLEFVINHFKQLNDSITQYIRNLGYGVKAGFVRSVEECEIGLFTIKRKFSSVSSLGAKGQSINQNHFNQ